MESNYTLLRWIPLLPLLAAVIHAVILVFIRRPVPRRFVVNVSCGAVIASFLLSCMALFKITSLPIGQRNLKDTVYSWIGSGSLSADVGFVLDPLSAVMILVVTGVGSLIHIYSVGYMDDDHREDKGFQRFFCYLNLFTFSMLVLVLGDNLVLLFLGWEGVGLCSYLLIGFWYSDRFNAFCGSKAFIVNRIGDFGFLVGLFLLFWSLADAGEAVITFRDIEAGFARIASQTVTLPGWLHFLPGAPDWKLATIIGLCFFLGAAGKSAQIPLYVWLPDAMAGPTPVSALIHAATMVTAGVYLVCRMSFIYAAGPGAAAVVAWTGGVTALVAALIAIGQTDIKKVLAYSTVSQLGYMFLAAGCGAYSAAMFHVVTHAFFKALLFLGAGAVILAMHHEQNTDKMGGLRPRLPMTHGVFLIGVLAIAGFPYMSGFFSKDEILLSAYVAHEIPGHSFLYLLGLGTAGLTAFYMFRIYFRTFSGTCRAPSEIRSHIQEPSWWVIAPLFVLAFLSVFGGFLGPSEALLVFQIEGANSFANFVGPVLSGAHHDVSYGTERTLAFVATCFAVFGAAVAYWFYVLRPDIPMKIRARVGFLVPLFENKFYIDEIYDAVIVRPLVSISDAFLYRSIDAAVIDNTGVNGVGRAVRAIASDILKYAQTGFAQGYMLFMVIGSIAIVGYLLR